MTTDTTLDTESDDGKTLAALDDIEEWEKNPRDAADEEIERLAGEIENLGQYKPLIVDQDGTILGGNMRFRALQELGESHAWVSVVECEDDDERLEYALSDNDRVGHYVEEEMAGLIGEHEVDITDYKIDFYEPQDMSQYLAAVADPDEILGSSGSEDEDDEDDADAPSDSDGDSGDDGDTPRNMEELGEESTTTMVQLYLTQSDKDQLLDQVKDLKKHFGIDNTTDVITKAVDMVHAEVDEDRDNDLTTAAEMVDGGE